MEKYLLFMDKTGEIVKRDIAPKLRLPNLADEVYALAEQYRKVIQSLENIFGNLLMGFHNCAVMMEENKVQNNKPLLQEHKNYIFAMKMNTDRVIDSIRSIKEMLMEHCCLVNNLIDSVKETERTLGEPFRGIEKIKEYE